SGGGRETGGGNVRVARDDSLGLFGEVAKADGQGRAAGGVREPPAPLDRRLDGQDAGQRGQHPADGVRVRQPISADRRNNEMGASLRHLLSDPILKSRQEGERNDES